MTDCVDVVFKPPVPSQGSTPTFVGLTSDKTHFSLSPDPSTHTSQCSIPHWFTFPVISFLLSKSRMNTSSCGVPYEQNYCAMPSSSPAAGETLHEHPCTALVRHPWCLRGLSRSTSYISFPPKLHSCKSCSMAMVLPGLMQCKELQCVLLHIPVHTFGITANTSFRNSQSQ